jgi:hypothetical protein
MNITMLVIINYLNYNKLTIKIILIKERDN